MDKRVFIDGSWPYLYTIPGLHNLIPTLRADVYARWSRLQGREVLFVVGFDEYGTRAQLMADRLNKSPQELIDDLYPIASTCFELLKISADIMLRSSDYRHSETSQMVVSRLQGNNWIFEQDTVFAFCENCNRLLPDRLVEGRCPNCGGDALGDQCKQCGFLLTAVNLIDPKCTICGQSASLKQQLEWHLDLPRILSTNPSFLTDNKWSPEVRAMTAELLQSIKPLTISRHLDWGIPFPNESLGRVIYNWVESVIGDISAAAISDEDGIANFWRSTNAETIFFMGKDNVPFFSLLLSGILLGMGEDLAVPTEIVPNGFMLFDGEVCSKVSGKGIRINEAVAMLDPDIWRYAIAKLFGMDTTDVDFTWSQLANIINRDLVGIIDRYVKHVHSVINELSLSYIEENIDMHLILPVLENFGSSISRFEFRNALEYLLIFAKQGLSATNKPFLIHHIRAFTVMASVVLPYTSERIWQIFGFKDELATLNFDKIAHELRQTNITVLLNPISTYAPLFARTTAKKLELQYDEVIHRPEILTLRGIGELCPCENWTVNGGACSISN